MALEDLFLGPKADSKPGADLLRPESHPFCGGTFLPAADGEISIWPLRDVAPVLNDANRLK